MGIQYEIDENSRSQTFLNRSKAYGMVSLLCGGFIFSVFFLAAVIKMFKEAVYGEFIINSVIMLNIIFVCMIVFAKKLNVHNWINIGLYLFLFSALFSFLLGIAQLCNQNYWGFLVVFISVLMLLIFVVLKILNSRKEKGWNTSFFKDRVN